MDASSTQAAGHHRNRWFRRSNDALRALVAHLPADLAASIFVTIHIPADFPSILPRILRSAGRLPAVHPADKQRTRPGMIYVAPPDFHWLVEKG
jgi:two-component system, chemotaxis family, protein-glutamate methylesterase/glutaminase